MNRAYERPFRPLEITDSLATSFSLLDMGHQLTQEEVFDRVGRNSLTLARGQNLTVVLLVLNTHAELPDHQAPGPITVTVLAGHIQFSTRNEPRALTLKTGEAGLCAAHLIHSVRAQEKSIVLLTIGGQA